jgi:hypothetical protein
MKAHPLPGGRVTPAGRRGAQLGRRVAAEAPESAVTDSFRSSTSVSRVAWASLAAVWPARANSAISRRSARVGEDAGQFEEFKRAFFALSWVGYHGGMADSTFDIVSKVDPMEVDNALNQAHKEVAQRYDFKNVGASIAMSGEKVLMKANTEERVKAILEVFEAKLIKRGISLRSLDAGEPFASGKEYRIETSMKAGIDQENAKKISKIIRDEGPKGVKSQIQGDELRVSSKSRDDLQAVMALLKGKDLDVALQFTNFR